jgi:hypothetical protein
MHLSRLWPVEDASGQRSLGERGAERPANM